jgi:hypothetical protein
LKGLEEDAGIELLNDQGIAGEYADLQKFTELADGHPLLLKLAASWIKARGERAGYQARRFGFKSERIIE